MFVWWIFVLINLRYIIDYSLFFEYKHLSWNIVNGHLENSQVLQQILDLHECLDLLFLMLTQQKHWWMLMFYFFISLVAENLSPPLYFATCLFQKPLSSDQIRKKKRRIMGGFEFLFPVAWRQGHTRELFKTTDFLVPL